MNRTKKATILYVDDEEYNLITFKDTFRRKFEIFTTTSAKEGIEILKTNKIDLILSDQRMPEMSGVDLLKYSLEKYPELNRILITGYSDIDAIENAINHAHVFQYVQKPWEESKLLKIIENALHIYHLEAENKQQKRELIKAKEKAEESDLLKTEFLSNMSHEIRTPMNGILNFSEILKRTDLTNKKREYFLEIIQNSGNQLMRIIEDILEISKLGTNQVLVEENQVCLNTLLAEQFTIFNEIANEKKLEFNLIKQFTEKENRIVTDNRLLTRIVNTLLENALKFTNEGSVEFGYQLIEIEAKKCMQIYIKDTGIGINAKNKELIFKRFTQEDKELTRNFNGLGLGLSISKANAKLLGGEITFHSKKGKGTTFFVNIPYKPISSQE